MRQGILFCTPCYAGLVTAQFWKSTLLLNDALHESGIEHDWNIGWNESLVHRARNEMTAAFLKTDFSHMMWLDADIEFAPDDVAKLWNLETEIAVAAYAMKRPDKPLSAWKDGKLVKLDECPKEPFAVDFAGTGFMLLRRNAIEKIHQQDEDWESKARCLVERLYYEDGISTDDMNVLDRMLDSMSASYQGPNGRVPALYMTPVHNDGLESEDYHLCRLALECGMKVIMDPSIRLGHIGQFRYGHPD